MKLLSQRMKYIYIYYKYVHIVYYIGMFRNITIYSTILLIPERNNMPQ